MANSALFAGSNFQASDSPATHDIRAAIGTTSIKTVTFLNSGPGTALIERSYDNGDTFESGVPISAAVAISGGPVDGIDQIRVSHLGTDFDYIVVATASDHPLVITSIIPANVYFAQNYFEILLLDGSTIDMAVDGSITPVEYSFTVPTDRRIRISKAVLYLEDGNSNFDSGVFADLGSSLTNGVEVSVTPDGGSPIVLTNWKNNRDIRASMSIFAPQSEQTGKGGEYRGVWDISNILSAGIGLRLNDGDKFSITIQDDLGPLNFMSFMILALLEFVG